MYDFNDILSELQRGVSAEEIAQAFANQLNDAIDQHDDVTAITEASDEMADAYNTLLDLYIEKNGLPEGVSDDMAESLYLSGDEALGIIEDIYKDLVVAAKLERSLGNLKDALVHVRDEAESEGESFSNTMREFFKSLGL